MPGPLSEGGIESVAMNLQHYLISRGHAVDFVCHGEEKGIYEEEAKKRGSNIYHIPVKSENLIGTIKQFSSILQRNKYDVVHSHMNATGGIYLQIAKKYNIPVRVAHSHASSMKAFTTSKLHGLINFLEKSRTIKFSNIRIACSNEAGRWLFGTHSYTVVLNAVDVEKFSYNPEIRSEVRETLGITEHQLVAIHVGGFVNYKNHEFLIKVFSDLKDTKQKILLYLVGDGEYHQKIEDWIKKSGLEKTVIMLGRRTDVNNLLQAADVFLLPSTSEGNPVALAEAATAGLHCIVSDQVSKDIVPYFPEIQIDYLPINSEESADLWRHKILEKTDRIDYRDKYKCKLSSDEMGKIIEELYNKQLQSIRLRAI